MRYIMKKFTDKRIISGAVWLGLGALAAKTIGALYRIPLTNLLGSYGLGLYQMVFPVYTLLLDFSGAGVPAALSKLISSSSEIDRESVAYNYLKGSQRLLAVLGLIGTILMLTLSFPLSYLQGDKGAAVGYIFLAPSVFLVAVLSCYRGYFQGLMNMIPTALSQVVEQVIKLTFGLIFCNLFMPDIQRAVAGATLAITLSEIAAVLLLYIVYQNRKRKIPQTLNYNKTKFKGQIKNLIKVAIPVTLVGVMLPLSHVIDSFTVVNVLKAYREDATSLYGLMSGTACTVIHLPVAVCYGIATVAIPAVSSAKGYKDRTKKAVNTLLLTLAASIPAALLCYYAAPTIVKILFKSLSLAESQTAVNLIRTLSPTVVLLSLLQTSNAVLIGGGKLYVPVISLSVGLIVKTVLSIILLKNPQINIYGSAIGLIACYFTVCLINLIVISKERVEHADKRTVFRRRDCRE